MAGEYPNTTQDIFLKMSLALKLFDKICHVPFDLENMIETNI